MRPPIERFRGSRAPMKRKASHRPLATQSLFHGVASATSGSAGRIGGAVSGTGTAGSKHAFIRNRAQTACASTTAIGIVRAHVSDTSARRASAGSSSDHDHRQCHRCDHHHCINCVPSDRPHSLTSKSIPAPLHRDLQGHPRPLKPDLSSGDQSERITVTAMERLRQSNVLATVEHP